MRRISDKQRKRGQEKPEENEYPREAEEVVDHGQCGCEDVISEIWSNSKSPVQRDLVQCGRDHAADGQQQCAGEDAGQMEISEIWTSLSPAEGNSVQCDDDHAEIHCRGLGLVAHAHSD